MSMATHNWPGTSADLRRVPKSDDESDDEIELEIAANRSYFDEHAAPIRTRHSDSTRLAPLRRPRILIGGGWRRKLPRLLRELGPLLAVIGALVVIGWWGAS
jgi:hypothetical protein